MLAKFMRYTFAAAALYVVVYNGSKSGDLITKGAQGYATGVRALEGR